MCCPWKPRVALDIVAAQHTALRIPSAADDRNEGSGAPTLGPTHPRTTVPRGHCRGAPSRRSRAGEETGPTGGHGTPPLGYHTSDTPCDGRGMPAAGGAVAGTWDSASVEAATENCKACPTQHRNVGQLSVAREQRQHQIGAKEIIFISMWLVRPDRTYACSHQSSRGRRFAWERRGHGGGRQRVEKEA